MVQLTSADGHTFDAYEMHPDGATASIVVIQEIFGVNSHIRSVAMGYAAKGYRVVAPALFDRVERNIELGYDQADLEAGIGLASKLDWENTMADVNAAVAHVVETGPVGIVGYCFGGTVAWLAASSSPVSAAVGYYGGGVHGFIDRSPTKPTMLHFGALDAHIPLDGVNEVAARYPEVAVHIYDEADHGFNCDARESFDKGSAERALSRTIDFFESNGVVGS